MRIKPKLNFDMVRNSLCVMWGTNGLLNEGSCPKGTGGECETCILGAPVEEFKQYLLGQLEDKTDG